MAQPTVALSQQPCALERFIKTLNVMASTHRVEYLRRSTAQALSLGRAFTGDRPEGRMDDYNNPT